MREWEARPCTTLRSSHAEGPAWDDRRGELLWVDIPAGEVHRGVVGVDGRSVEVVASHSIGQPVGAVVPAAPPDAGWLLATELGFAHLDPAGDVQILFEPEAPATRGIRMNDGKCDPLGRFWAGSMAYDQRPGAARLYMLDRSMRLHVQLEPVTISNGLAWSRDGQTMFYIDTATHRIDRLDLGDDGSIRERGVAFHIDPRLGVPDGMTIDREGCLWVALWGGGAVARYAPTGELLARVHVESEKVSSCTFGGPKLTTLFITTSREDFSEAEERAQSEAGFVHSVELGVAGFPADRYAGPWTRAEHAASPS